MHMQITVMFNKNILGIAFLEGNDLTLRVTFVSGNSVTNEYLEKIKVTIITGNPVLQEHLVSSGTF